MAVISSGGALATLRRIYADLVEARGAVAFVPGPILSSKTTLLNEIRRLAHSDGATVLHASCSIFDRANTLIFARQLLRPDFLPGLPYVSKDLGAPPHAELLEKIDRAFNAVHQLSAKCTVAICVDDVRYADVASRLFIEQLAASIEHRPVLLVLADRSSNGAPAPAWTESALTGVHWISLTSLSVPDIRALAFDECAIDVSDSYAEAVLMLSNGNWLLARALLHDHVANRDLLRAAGGDAPVVGCRYRQAVLQ